MATLQFQNRKTGSGGIAAKRRRRGVLLLVVLSLLAIFALLLISFVTITNHARRASESVSDSYQEDESAVEARALLNDAAAQVTRGSTSLTSVLFPHSLLEDMYGGDTLGVRPDGQPLVIGGLSGIASGQILNLVPNVASLTPTQLQQLRDQLARRVGCVLTVGSSTAYQSFRVVGFNSTNATLQVWNETEQTLEGPDQKWGKAGFDDDGNGTPDDATEFGWPGSDDLLHINDLFVINGTPFSGTGFGLNVTSGSNPGRNDATDSTLGKLLALQPNYLWNNAAAAADPADPFLLGGANEDYDASDYQNMVLAIVLPDGSVIPSLHRPELVNYWRNAPGSPWNNPNPNVYRPFRRRVLLRPLVEDNPNFAVVNQAFNPGSGSYDPVGGRDVDTDGDGVRDSIWVDLGASVRSMSGQMCKPLFAILCLDLDGRLNLNAHGAVAQTDSSYYGNIDPTAAQYKLWTWANSAFIFSGGVTPNLPRGMGYGPADVNLLPLFGTGGTALTAYANFLGHATSSRYAPDGLATTGRDAMLEANKWYEYNVNYWNLTAADTRAYGSPPNRLTDGAIGIDPGGRPLYCGMGRDTERGLDPYKLNLVKVSATNSPFTVGELERLLRQYDADAIRLPARLVSPFGLQGRAREVTTESWDVPSPAFKLPEYLSKEIATDAKNTGNADVRNWLVARLVACRVQDLLAAKYYVTRQHNNDTQRSQAIQDTDTWIRANAAALLPVELLSGRKMDVNRPFGNGRDENSNNVVDEPAEATTSELLTLYNPDGSTYTVAFNHTDQRTDTPALARQLYARYLYVLATALIDDGYFPDWTTGSPANRRAARARWIAQWAVNVVDFRDRDSIMTAFEYDPDPLGVDGNAAGWRPDGNLTTDDGITAPHVVWGCERPDLLITETLATHARRTLNSADVGEGEWSAVAPSDTPPADWDDDFDQTVKPEGSLFIEVYNPWSPLEPRPAEMSDATTGGIRLNKTAPGGDPVWRMAIAGGDESDKDPDADDSSDRPTILRSVYFADRPTGYTDDGDVQFEANDTAEVKPIGPGQYGIIGPGRDYRGDGKYITCFGRLTAADAAQDPDLSKLDATRRIVLDPAATGGSPVQTNGGSEPSAAQIQPVVSVVIDKPHRLNISHPNDDYAVPISPATVVPSDKPMDYPRTYDQNKDPFAKAISGKIPFLQSGTTPKVAVVYLQRLADPTRPYHATTNPYRTIDSAIVDLVAFNGWDVDDAIDPTSVQGTSPVRTGTMMFADNERGTENAGGDGADNIWVQHLKSKTPAATSKESPETHLFPYILQHTLGFLNKTYTTNRLTSGANRGDPDTSVAGTPAFPWLTWNNRPFVSPMEVLLVPSATSSRLLNEAITTDNVPTDSFGIGGSSAYSTEAGPFTHLMNFANSSASDDAPRLYQLLDLLGVPSPFVGTELQVNATELAKTANQHALYPPFHFGVSYRDPGRINLNTIVSSDVWKALTNDMDATGNPTRLGSRFTQFAVSRRGYTGGATWYATDNDYPTRFANPFRSGGATRLNPITPPLLGAEVEGTLLRPDPTPAHIDKALLGFDSSRFGTVPDCVNPDRNPFFRYQSLARLSNLVTTRSNVYAVWITLGYFEVTSGVVDDAHPDGYYLGAELGSGGGTVTRHRGFYLIDRSIPVGFIRGQDVNTGNAIRLMRFIE